MTTTNLRKGSSIQLNQPRAARTGILLLLLLLLTLPTLVQAQFTFTTNNGAITITGYTGPGGDVTIPDATNGYPVTSIGTSAFNNCTNLTSVTMGTNLTSIGTNAFSSCTSLTSVTIGTNVTSIGKNAFIYCSRLTSITIPDSVAGIGQSAFMQCTSLTNATIGTSVTNIGDTTFYGCTSLTSVTIGNSVTNIGYQAFYYCNHLSSVTIPNSVTSIGKYAFQSCTSLSGVFFQGSAPSADTTVFQGDFNNLTAFYLAGTTNWTSTFAGRPTLLWDPQVPYRYTTNNGAITITGYISGYTNSGGPVVITIPSTINGLPVTSIASGAFQYCYSLTSLAIPNSITNIENNAFAHCTSLTNVTIGSSVTSIGTGAFAFCTILDGVYFQGNAPSVDTTVFLADNKAIVYYMPGTTGWDHWISPPPAVLWSPPTIQTSPQTQTAEAGSAVGLWVDASSQLPLCCLWYLNDTNLISWSANCELELTNVQFSQSGAYTAVITNAAGAITSSPAMLNVIASVERRPVPGVKVTGETASLLNVDYANSLNPAPDWTTLGSVSLTSTSQYCFDLTLPLPPQRYYQAWQTGTLGVVPSVDLHLVPAITLTGNIGDALRLDYINQFGPTDTWATLGTVTLTNASQLYFDVSAPGQPQRLYRLVQVP